MRVHEFTIEGDLQRDELLRISSLASQFASDIKLIFGGDENPRIVDVKSLLGMMLLPIYDGSTVRISARGQDELEALEYMCGLFEHHGCLPH
ncbi:HPr family phosphocarrier protein [Saccharibacillus sp. CPCC 101409]|uniref:HPr family phosphocarrier protein n=1 Tax=Saccharibacillus sp. CPCC 101409 TaxID=3058041 RepID=UPI002671A04D|nr:HPr family phosphocarrier protein [Saccharibacillus sp. CPCC 101409]MDO3411748.1 HPr family phosphocarrier protein [Saccharibacillus sp. CPCC 101409]